MVLVPRASLLGNTTITQHMVEAHIYKPSPLFKDQYDSIGKPVHKIWVRDRIISTHEGFPVAMEAHVISEELFYNRQYQPFRVLCIDRVLTSPLSSDSAEMDDPFQRRTSYLDHVHLLKLYVGDAVITRFDELCRVFNTSYIHVKGFLHHLQVKMGALATSAVDIGLVGGKDVSRLGLDPRGTLVLRQSVDCYVLHATYPKIFAAVTEEYHQEVEQFQQNLDKFAHMSATDVGVPARLDCDLTKPITFLQSLNEAHSPFEKLVALKMFVEQVSYTAQNHLSKLGLSDPLATDDLLPLVVCCILRSGLSPLPLHLHYCSAFAFSLMDVQDLSFNLVTVQAAVQYINEDLALPTSSQVPSSTSITSPPAIHASAAPLTTTHPSLNAALATPPSSSPTAPVTPRPHPPTNNVLSRLSRGY